MHTFLFTLALLSARAHDLGCETYLKRDAAGHCVGVTRIESLLGRQVRVVDVSGCTPETRSRSDRKLRVVNLGDFMALGRMFVGFGRPNVYLALPGVAEHGLGYKKVGAKSLWRGDTKLERTLDRVQSGLFATFPDLDQATIDRVYEASLRYEGTRRATCVNTNCQILADSGFTIGGESIRDYYFPVPLLRDMLRYGLELEGKPVRIDLIKTTPGYLERVGLSIVHSVAMTMCRHAERACDPYRKRLERSTFVMRINDGLRTRLGVAVLEPHDSGAFPPAALEAKLTRVAVPPELLRTYDLDVSEPSRFGTLLRMLWGPHSLFRIPLDPALVNAHLPETLRAFPQDNPSALTRMKKHVLFAPRIVRAISTQLNPSFRRLEGLTQTHLFDMLRTDTPEKPHRYNFVVTGDQLSIMKVSIQNGWVDWILSKHVLVSGYSDDLRFAGEIWKDADGVVHISNNSGTYRPDAPTLARVLELFRLIFPGVNAVTEPA